MPTGRFSKLVFGTGFDSTDNADGSLTVAVSGAPPTGTAGGDLGGSYPSPAVVAVDDAVLASGTPSSSTFLRGDRTWQSITVDPAADTMVWMPLADSDGILVLDADDALIPTLIPI